MPGTEPLLKSSYFLRDFKQAGSATYKRYLLSFLLYVYVSMHVILAGGDDIYKAGDMPLDCWQNVAKHLNPPSLARAALVNRTLRDAASDD